MHPLASSFAPAAGSRPATRNRRALPTLAAAVALGIAPAPVLADWSAPLIVAGDNGEPVAAGAFGGSVWLGTFERVVSVARRSGDRFSAPERITLGSRLEEVYDAGFAHDGEALVITVRQHAPVRRVRATLVDAGGARIGPRTISSPTRTARRPELSVAADGTAAVAWQQKDFSGWRVQAAIRRPGERHFGPAQTLSPASTGRMHPRFRVAAGIGGRAVLTWRMTDDTLGVVSPLQIHTADIDSRFGAAQTVPRAGTITGVGLALGPAGEVAVGELHRGPGHASFLRVISGTAGAPLSSPVILSTGGDDLNDGSEVEVAFGTDGSATVAWVKPREEFTSSGGELELFTRPAGGTFGPAQLVARQSKAIDLAAGPGASAAVVWMRDGERSSVHAATRPYAGGPFGPDTMLSMPGSHAIWPSVAITPAGDAIAAWSNATGSGEERSTAAIFTPPLTSRFEWSLQAG